jgi:uncharacterized protein YfaS (alpha-2-macroglobulin family)
MANSCNLTNRRAVSKAVAALAFLAILAAGGIFATGNGAADGPAAPAAATAPAVTPVFARTTPARNPATMCLLADERKVVGWISGKQDAAGKEVTVECNGLTQSVLVQEGNVFTWRFKADKPVEAAFTLGSLKQTIKLQAASAPGPTAFFVVDRTAYRPQQALHFAAFLRQMDDHGNFAPLARTPVKVTLVSEKKKTTAAELALTSDEQGRIVGDYTFTDADALDNYDLAVAGYKGAAKVALAEYRKSKIRLKITGKEEAREMKIAFQALDFLDKPVGGSKVRYTVQVVSKARKTVAHTLKGEDFAYYQTTAWMLPDLEGVSEEEQLLCESEPGFLPAGGSAGDAVLAQVSGDLDLPAGKAEHCLPIKQDWCNGKHAVLVQGVLVDSNGREQKAAEQISLGGTSKKFELAVGRRYYEPGEPIRVTASGAGDEKGRPTPTTLVAMRLSPSLHAGTVDPYGYGNSQMQYQSQMMPAAYSNRMVSAAYIPSRYRWSRYRPQLAVERTMATAAAFKDGVAELKLAEPGAYMLVGVAQLPDGTTLQGEAGCIVRDEEDLAGLALELDKAEYVSGETVKGIIHSRYADARVLLSIRDGTGVRFWKPIQLQGGTGRISHVLTDDLRYGCSIDVQYADEPGRVQVAEKFIRVVPEAKLLKVATTLKDRVDAGEKVRIDIQVNRLEAVDLVVSVYDQSLLGIAPDKFTDIRNFYLADERVRDVGQRELLRRRLAGVTLGAIAEQARKVLDDKKLEPNSAEYRRIQQAMANYNGNYLYIDSIATFLDLAGIKTNLTWSVNYFGRNWGANFDKTKAGQIALFDIIDSASSSQWRLAYCFLGPTMLLAETHPSYAAQPGWTRDMMYQRYGGGGYAARGDAMRGLSGNSSFSEGQAFVSHLPGPAAGGAPPPSLIDVDPADAGIAVRRDFSDAAYWNAAVRTDGRGQATVEFKLPDSLTNWQVVVTAVTNDMSVGTHKARFTSTKPIMVWPMLPRVFTEGDKVEIYGSVHNRTDKDQAIKVSCKVDNGRLLSEPRLEVRVPAGKNVPVYWTFQAGEAGFTQILMAVDCPGGSDASLKRLPVVASSVEEAVTASGFCKGPVAIDVPKDADLTKGRLDITIAPTLAADMVDTLDYLVEYPHGCVEQTMSRFLPAIKVAQVLAKFDINHPGLKAKLPGCVEGGIKRLLELQQPDGGWGWNGSGQTHEMMTPYALYGLLEAEKAGYRIGNETAVNRGLDRLKAFIDNMTDKQAADRIYCMYVYAHRRDLDQAWWKFIDDMREGKKLSDYATALALELAVRKDKAALSKDLAQSLRASAVKNGGDAWWTTAGFSRWGDDRNEITAAAMKALVAYDVKDPLIASALSYFAQAKCGNRWNSTKDTAMIIYAMCDFLARQEVDLRGAKTAVVSVNDGEKTTVKSEGGLMKKITVDGSKLKMGRNTVNFDDVSPGMLYRLSLRYRRTGSDLAPQNSGLIVSRTFYLLDEKGARKRQVNPGDTVPRGAYVECMVSAGPHRAGDMRYVLVNCPKPAGAEILPTDDIRYGESGRPCTHYVLREDRTAAVLYHHEQTADLTDRYVLHAEMAGQFVVAPASVELMYQTDVRGHSGTFRFSVGDEQKVAAK